MLNLFKLLYLWSILSSAKAFHSTSISYIPTSNKYPMQVRPLQQFSKVCKNRASCNAVLFNAVERSIVEHRDSLYKKALRSVWIDLQNRLYEAPWESISSLLETKNEGV